MAAAGQRQCGAIEGEASARWLPTLAIFSI